MKNKPTLEDKFPPFGPPAITQNDVEKIKEIVRKQFTNPADVQRLTELVMECIQELKK